MGVVADALDLAGVWGGEGVEGAVADEAADGAGEADVLALCAVVESLGEVAVREDRRSREAAAARETAEVMSQRWSRSFGERSDFELLPSHRAGRLDSVQRLARERVRAMA